MTLLHYIYLYFLTVPILVVMDLFWLGFFAKGFYQDRLLNLLGPVNWSAAVLFYFIFSAGLLIFVVMPALDSHSLTKALALGSLYGLVTYATYNLTNMATLKGWLWSVVTVDMLWGAFLGMIVSLLSYLIGTFFYS